MELFDKLLDVALELEILVHKKEDSSEKSYEIPIEYYLEQEKRLLQSISKAELDQLISHMEERFGFSFEGTFFPKFFLFKENHWCVLRVYREIFELNQFYQLQTMSEVSHFEAEKLGISSYLLGVRERAQVLLDFEKTLLNHYLFLEDKYKEVFSYLYFPKNEFCSTEVLDFTSSGNLMEELLEFIGADIFSLSKNVFEHCLNSELLCVFQSYFSTLEEEYYQDVFKYIKGAYITCQEKNETLSWDWVSNFLKDYSAFQLDFESLEPLVIKPRQKIKRYSYYDIDRYETVFFSILEITKSIWDCSKKVIESKLNHEPKNKRAPFYDEIKSLLSKRESSFQHISNFEEFRYYISYVYGVEEDVNPFLNARLAEAVTHCFSLDDIEAEYSLIEEFAARSVLNSSVSIELDSEKVSDGVSVSLEEKEEDLSEKVKRLEAVLKECIHYFRETYDEETFVQKMQDLNFDIGEIDGESEENTLREEIEYLVYSNFQFCLLQYLKNHDSSSLHYRELFYTHFLSQFLDGDLEYLIQTDLERDFIFMEHEPIDSDDLMDLHGEYCSQIHMMCEQCESRNEFYDIVFQIYLEALSSVFPEKSLSEFQDIYTLDTQILKRG